MSDYSLNNLINRMKDGDESLSTIDLRSNMINDDSLKLIADTLNRSRIITLDISGNPITDVGIEYLMNTLKNNRMLRTLIMEDIDITKKGLLYINDMLNTNKTLYYVELGDLSHLDDQQLVDDVEYQILERYKDIEWYPYHHRFIVDDMFKDDLEAQERMKKEFMDKYQRTQNRLLMPDEESDIQPNSGSKLEESFSNIFDTDVSSEDIIEIGPDEDIEIIQNEDEDMEHIMRRHDRRPDMKKIEKENMLRYNLALFSQEFDKTISDLLNVFAISKKK
jgi:hypothetical protein